MRWLFVLALALVPATAAVAADKKLPYWASISPSEARLRTGPGRNFPATWLYRRAGLPVRVVGSVPAWRRIVDPDGATGWIQANLLSDKRTGFVRGNGQVLRVDPDNRGRVLWQVELGVVGGLSKCNEGWCMLDVKGRRGYLPKAALWGIEPAETLP